MTWSFPSYKQENQSPKAVTQTERMREQESSSVEIAKQLLEYLTTRGTRGFPGEEAWKGETFFDFLCSPFITISTAERGRIICSFQIPLHLTDVEGNWHTGAIATMIDNVACAAVVTVIGVAPVSVDFGISYFAPAKFDEEVEIDATTVEHKGKLTLVSVQVRRKGDGRLVASARQWMVSVLPSRVRSKI